MYTIGQWFRKHFNQKRLKANPNRNNHLRVYSGHFLSKKVTICFWLIAWLVVYFSGLFTVIRPYMVQFSEIENPTVRFGAVLRKRKSYGAVCCGFEKHEILRCCSVLWYILRCGSARFPVERFFYGAAPLSVGKTCNTVFAPRCTVWINRTKPRFRTVLALFLGARPKPFFPTVSLRCTVLINRTNPRVRTVFCLFFTSRQSHQQQQVLGPLKNRFNYSICTYI